MFFPEIEEVDCSLDPLQGSCVQELANFLRKTPWCSPPHRPRGLDKRRRSGPLRVHGLGFRTKPFPTVQRLCAREIQTLDTRNFENAHPRSITFKDHSPSPCPFHQSLDLGSRRRAGSLTSSSETPWLLISGYRSLSL